MNGDLEFLLQLQNIDYDLGELERSKEYIPDMIDNLRREIADIKTRVASLKEELTAARLEQRQVEATLQDKTNRLKVLQGQMMSIKTNKEYDALVTEIDRIKEAINQLEARGFELLGIMESREKELGELDGQMGKIEKVNGEQLSSLQQQIDTVGSKIDNKRSERDNLVKQINRRVVATYDRIRKGKGGAAVVAVKKRACGACYKALPPQRIQEIRRGDQILTCDSCGRMLIWTEGSDI